MMHRQKTEDMPEMIDHYRRTFLKRLGLTTATVVSTTSAHGAWGGKTLGDAFADFFQQHYQRMTTEELKQTLGRIERKAQKQYGVNITCTDTPPVEGVVFGYAINISKCKGYRDCVEACATENNLSADIRYIHVLELDKGSMNLELADRYYEHETVPVEGKYYLPIQCMQCDNPPCVKLIRIPTILATGHGRSAWWKNVISALSAPARGYSLPARRLVQRARASSVTCWTRTAKSATYWRTKRCFD